MSDQPTQINLHFDPELLGGVYANFANVSHSEYEFTITFARVEHEVDGAERPGVVVTRVNLGHRFFAELLEAMQDNYSKFCYSRDVQNLPETPERPPQGGMEPPVG